MELLIDDIRDMGIDVIARRSEPAKFLLQHHSRDTIYFDHDLGYESESGYEILKWALEVPGRLRAQRIVLVTNNPVGFKNMEALLKEHRWKPTLIPTQHGVFIKKEPHEE